MIKILKFLYILQSKKRPNDKLGLRQSDLERLNPYNPLSYLFFTGYIILGIILYGILGFWKEADLSNPFKWR